jgi:hypothetical protein
MWNIDKQNYEEEEKRLRDRINNINKDNADYLMRQMAEKTSTQTKKKMNRAEFAINKPILREANMKLKDVSQGPMSRQDEMSVQEQI